MPRLLLFATALVTAFAVAVIFAATDPSGGAVLAHLAPAVAALP
jgi:hypothetical protein